METQVFHEFDAFANSVSGVDSKMLLRDPERRNWTIDRVGLPGIELQIGRLGSGNIACGQTHAECCMFYLPLTAGIEYRGNGNIIERDTFFVLYPNAEFCITTRESHDWLAVTIPIEPLAEDCKESIARPCRVARRESIATQRIKDIVANVMTAAATNPGFEETQASERAASMLLDLLRPFAGQRRTTIRQATGRPKIMRDEIIQRSLAILEDHPREHPSVAELALNCGISERTLRTAFREYFGLGPSRFLQLRQLHNVRRTLRKSDPDQTSVAQVMADNGVWALGRFASRYSELFGELPSTTLRAFW